MMLVRFFLIFSGFILYIFAVENLHCHITSNAGFVANQGYPLILYCSPTGIRHGSLIAGQNRTNINSTIAKWKKDDHLIVNLSSSTLSRRNITRKDAGKYECTLVNGSLTSETCTFCLKVNAAPKVLFARFDQESSTMKLPCLVNGYPKPTVIWYKNGRKIPLNEEKYFVTNEPIDGQKYWSYLEKTYPDRNDTGNYTCVAENIYGASNCTTHVSDADIDDVECAEFRDPKKRSNITVTVGQSKSLVCRVLHTNRRLPDYSEIKRNVSVHTKMNHQFSRFWKGKELIMNYTIVNATVNDTGEYFCLYLNAGKVSCHKLRKSIYLKVVLPMVTEQRKKKNKTIVTVAVSLTGAVLGLGLVVLMWYLRRKRLKSLRFYDSLPELRWDVFISYSSEDFLWVKELYETLERPPFNLIVCLHQRDWELGRAVIDNMVDSVYCSQKTLIIMSKSYLKSQYCMQELQIAMHSEMMPQNVMQERIVLIKIDDVSLHQLPRALRQKSYIDCSDLEHRKHLKTKLLRSLPRHQPVCQTNEGNVDNCNNGDLSLQEVSLA